MAWNGSDQTGRAASMTPPDSRSRRARASRAPNPTIQQSKNQTILHGLLALLLIAALGGAAVWYFTRPAPKSNNPTIQKSNNSQIATVTPAPARTNAAPVAVTNAPAKPAWTKPYPPEAYWPDGRLKQHSRYVKVITNRNNLANMPVYYRVFKNSADRNIASLLTIKPGARLIGDRVYSEIFVESFKESLKTPIVADPSDSAYVRKMKEAVLAARTELKAKMDAGEDIAKIMTDTRRELKELGLYREELRKQVERIRTEKGDELSEKDEQDLINAANAMLEERGCEPLKLPKTFLKKMEMEK